MKEGKKLFYKKAQEMAKECTEVFRKHHSEPECALLTFAMLTASCAYSSEHMGGLSAETVIAYHNQMTKGLLANIRSAEEKRKNAN